MRQSAEIFIELTAQELLAPATARHLTKASDVGAADPLTARPATMHAAASPAVSANDCIEIELTPQEMDTLLGGDFSIPGAF